MTDAETLAAYARDAARYTAMPMTDLQTQALADFIDRLPPGARVLDVGCGPGLQAAAMIRAGHRVTGIDPTPDFVTEALHNGVDARLGSVEDVMAVAEYDAVHASFSLLHCPRADIPGHIARLARALRPGGVLFLGMKLGTGEGRDALGRFYTYVSEIELAGWIKAAGLTPERSVTGTGKGLAGTEDPYVLMTAHA